MDPYHRFFKPWDVIRELVAGRTLYRAYLNLALRGLRLDGTIVDLGSKSPAGSYWKSINVAPSSRIVCTDIEPGPGIVYVDVEEGLPFRDKEIDAVLALNLFEHVQDFRVCAKEITRVLRPGGTLIVVTPFLYPFHGDPQDFWRFTDHGLRSAFACEGDRVEVEALGEGVFSVAAEFAIRGTMPSTLGRLLMPFVYVCTTLCDRAAHYRKPVGGRRLAVRYPFGYLLRVRKAI